MKTIKKIVKITILALSVILLFACKPKHPGTDKVFTYSFDVQKDLSVESAGKLAAQIMDAHDVKLIVTDQKIAYYSAPEDASVTFEQDLNTGNLSFNKSMRKYYGNAAPKLPTADAADKIAREYLKKFNMMPVNDGEIRLVHKGGLRASSVIDGKKGGPIIDKNDNTFLRQIY